MTDKITVPITTEAEESEVVRTDEALRGLQTKGLEAVFMPAIADVRILAPKNARVWQNWYTAPSIRATGRTKQDNAVVIYAHVPNYFSNPDNIETAINQGLINGAGIIPQDEFQRLLDLEDNENVFIVDYDALKSSPSGVISLKDAIKHPQTVAFLGGQERAEKYLERHREVYGNEIGVWHSDDLTEQPLGRFLFLGNLYDDSLLGYNYLDDDSRFLGVRSAPQKVVLTREQLAKVIGDYVAPVNRQELEQRLDALFR